MGELKHIALGQRPEEAKSDIKQKLIIAGCIAVLLFLVYQLVLGSFERMPVIRDIRNAIFGSIYEIIYFFSRIIREIFSLFQ